MGDSVSGSLLSPDAEIAIADEIPGSSQPPAVEPLRSNVIPFVMPPPLDERDRLRAQLVSEIGYDHAMRFSRVKVQLNSTARGPHVNDTHEQLRLLVRSFSSLDDAKERLLHALAVREAEAITSNTLIHFGGQMWKQNNFDNASVREVSDVDGSRSHPSRSTGREATGLSAIMEHLAEDEEEKKAGCR